MRVSLSYASVIPAQAGIHTSVVADSPVIQTGCLVVDACRGRPGSRSLFLSRKEK